MVLRLAVEPDNGGILDMPRATLVSDQLQTVEVIIGEMTKGLDVLESVPRVVRRLTSIARELSKINLRQCNGYPTIDGGWDERAEKLDLSNEVALRSSAQALLDVYGLTVEFNGDPRGSAIRFKTPKTKRSNSFSGEFVWCIPE
jgi:hypothetical protein